MKNFLAPAEWQSWCCKNHLKETFSCFQIFPTSGNFALSMCPRPCGKIYVALLLNNAKSHKEVCKKKLQASPALNTALHKLFPQLVLCCIVVAWQSSVVPSHGELGAILGLLRRQGVLTVQCTLQKGEHCLLKSPCSLF